MNKSLKDEWCESCIRWEKARSRWEELTEQRKNLRRRILAISRKLIQE